jgi:multiple sugar transport system substrate-binding protein
VPVETGGQPPNFPLGIMQFPAMDKGACNECKTLAIGASFGINAASKHKDVAGWFLNAMSTPEMGKQWLETIYLQTAVKTEGGAFSGPYAAYFTELMQRQQGAKYFIGMPIDILKEQCKDTFTQVMNSSFPGGLLSVDDAIKMMDGACHKG